MNFQTILEELDRLYEELPAKEAAKKEIDEVEESDVVEACDKKSLTEEADDEEIEIVDDEAPEEEPEEEVEEPAVEEEEARQLILECDNCGALVIRAEADVKVDEETDLANVGDVCEFCEESVGSKIVGVVAPYEEALEEGIFNKKSAMVTRETIDATEVKKGDILAFDEECQETSKVVKVELNCNEQGDTMLYLRGRNNMIIPKGQKVGIVVKEDLEEGIFSKKKQDALDAELDPYKDNYWVCMYKPNGAKKYVYAQTPTVNKNSALARHKEIMSSNPEYKPYVCTYGEAQKASGSRYYESLEESDSVEEGIFGFGKKKKSADSEASGASESRVTISIYDENGTKKFAHTFTEIPGKMNAEDQFNELIKSNGVLRQFKASSKKSDWSYERKSEPASPRDTDKYFNAASKIIREQLDEVDQAEELEELLDFDLDVPVSVTANGNDVAVGGLA